MRDPAGPEILVVGDTYLDLVFSGLPCLPALGREVFAQELRVSPGGVFTVAVALSRLGHRVGLATELGTDALSEAVADAYRAEGIETGQFLLRDGPFPFVTVSLSFPGERAFVSWASGRNGATARFGPDLLERLPGARLLLLPGVENGMEALALAEAAHAIGMTVILDCQETARALGDPELGRLLACADAFLPNASETLRVTGEPDLDRAAKALLRRVPLVVVKQGAEGATAWRRDGKPLRSPAIVSGPVRDTTGAGDCFDAGFVHGWLQGASLRESLRFANACGGLAVTATGGATAAPTLDQMLAVLEGDP